MDANQTKIFFAILTAAGLLAIIVFYFFISIVRSQRRHLKLQQENLSIEITTLEKERKRIVSDLHDELGPLLAAVKLQLQCINAAEAGSEEYVQKALLNIDLILERIRQICNQLMPHALLSKGVITALSQFISDINACGKLEINFSHEEQKIDSNKSIHVYRMITEMVNNAVKHSGASTLQIALRNDKNKLILDVKDNGRGFDSDEIMKVTGGYGLRNIFSRTNILGGDMYLTSSPSTGTAYTIEIPLLSNES
jgi:two-component system, NarL family, sensor kinase